MTSSQTASARAATPTLGPITHVALTVRDLAVSVPFYRALIGAEPVLDEDTGPFRHVVFAVGGTLLGLHQFHEGIEELAHSPRRPGVDHVAFAAADRTELVAWASRLDELGIPHGDIVDAHYGSALAVQDPDGLPLEIFCAPSS
jgi:glyoxylase I family protein